MIDAEANDVPAQRDATRVTVAIPSRDRPDALCRVVRDVCAGRRRPDEIVVICQGNGAHEAARRLEREVPEALPLLRFHASSRTGVGAARNDAIRLATGQFVAFSDDDMRLPEAWLESMLDVWRREWDAGPVLLTGPIDAPEGTADAAATPGYRPGETRRVWRTPPASGDVLYGGHFGAPRSVYERAGSPPFDERFGPGSRFAGAGDEVFAFRLLRAGVPIALDPAIRATHVAHEREWIRSQFQHSRGTGALFVLRSSWGDRTAPGAAARTVAGILAKGARAAARLRFREAAGRFAAVVGIVHGALSWWGTKAGAEPSVREPGPGTFTLSRSTGVPGSTTDRVEVRVAAIILTLNQRQATLRCLDSLARSGATALAVVLLDNGSDDGTVAAVRREHPDVRVIRSERNLGAAAGRNAAAATAIAEFDPEFLLFLDNDTEVRAGFLEALLDPLETDPTLGQSVPKLLLQADPSRIDMAGGAQIVWWRAETTGRGRGEPDVGQYDEPGTCVAGGCTLVRTEAFQSVGGFDPVFDPYGYEDMDFSLRLAARGRACVYAPRAEILHSNTQTFEGGRYTARYAARKARNWLVFLFRHAPPTSRLAFLAAGLPWLVLRRIVKGPVP